MNRCAIKFAGVVLLGGMLAACGGGDFNNGSSGSSSSTGGGGSGGGTSLVVSLGSGTGSSFQSGVLQLSSTSLAAGGSTSVTATLENSDGTAYTQSATITFNSPCYQNGLATFAAAGTPGNTVTTTTGLANITYAANGCSGSDTITATVSINGSNLVATGTLTVAPPTIGSIQFVSATPTNITLKGVGGTNTSTVIFKVVDSTGGPVPGATVNFKLDSTAGGLSISPASAKTGNDGTAQTVVQAGTVSTTVRVTATVDLPSGNPISTQSSSLLVSTGFPTENGFSLSIATFNVEGGSIDGITDKVTARLADNFGNPVPDGTAVYFTTTGGVIQPGCNTTNGTCTVTWTSQNPRPDPGIKGPAIMYHAEIMAYAIGEESWTDTNANGIFDGSDTFSIYPGGAGDNFYTAGPMYDDIGELYLDQDETGIYKSGDWFYDFNQNKVRDAPSGMFHGAGCQGNGAVTCAPTATIAVGRQSCIVMSTSQMTIVGPTTLSKGQTGTYLVSDMNGNVPAATSKIGIVANGPTVSVLNPTVPNIPCEGSPAGSAYFAVQITVSSSSQSGTFVVSATSPSGLVSYSQTITVN